MSMDSSMLLALLLALFIPILLHLVTRCKYASYNLPSGSLGFPLIGQTISLLRALRKNTDYQWYQDRIKKYGPVSKMSVFGSPTVLLTGPAANRFAFCNPDLIFTQTKALNALVGVFFGEEAGPIREALATDFEALVKATLSIPVNIPFTKFNKGLSACWRIRKLLSRIAREREAALQQGRCSSTDDFFTYMIALRSEGTHLLTVEDIVDNAILLLTAGYETTSVLIIFLLRCLANESDILGNITEEQEEIARNKGPNEPLTWDDVSRMKYTWKVAMETLRTVPAIFGSFRTAIKDIEYQGYHIPKGWQIFTDQIVTHLDTNFFDEPRKFDPARFHNQSSIPPYCFLPFGGGPRMCPGNEFAKTGTLVAMHYLVRQFRWKLCCKEGYRKDPTPMPLLGLPIDLETRSPPGYAHS
uniref:Cytochrome P450 n=1 Tax=Oryza nivara TaxID=4536 RepID=A0A0E0I1G9_ORYNI